MKAVNKLQLIRFLPLTVIFTGNKYRWGTNVAEICAYVQLLCGVANIAESTREVKLSGVNDTVE